MSLNFFATCPKGLEGLLLAELQTLGVLEPRETVAGVSFKGTFQTGLTVCLWSRFASRVLMQLAEFYCADDTDLYVGAQSIVWERYFTPEQSIAVDFSGTSDTLRDTQYSAVKIKDAICDRFVQMSGRRPSVDRDQPEVRIFARLSRQQNAVVALDLSGGALLKREIQRQTGAAPLKENLAAAMVERSGYQGGNFLDPLCGSGTLLIEAALKLTDTAPGLNRTHFGFFKLKTFVPAQWDALVAEARRRHEAGLARALAQHFELWGFDQDEQVVSYARENVRKAGFAQLIRIDCCKLTSLYNPFSVKSLPLTCVTNPPYGVRMGNFNELISLYTELGVRLKQCCSGARVAVISSSEELLSCLRVRCDKIYHLFNGELPCQLRVFELREQAASAQLQEESRAQDTRTSRPLDFINRLNKNLAKYRKLASREGLEAYRVYDADVPEYAAAIDYYAGYYVIYAYEAPDSVAPYLARQHFLDLVQATIEVTGVSGEQVIVKQRSIQKGSQQYVKAPEPRGIFQTIHEHNCLFRVNLYDYLDTGLFLDGRLIRQRLRELAPGRKVLNLFAYTCTASVCAALGGAASTHSVDLSRTYLEWGMENFRLNGIPLEGHTFEQADCLSWLSEDHARRYDLIYLDPPTFSNSKRMSTHFEVKRDQLALLANLTRHLEDGGVVIFCTNQRHFKLDPDLGAYGYEIEDISEKTLPFDFQRTPKIHRCYQLKFSRANVQREIEPLAWAPATGRWSGELRSSAVYKEGSRPEHRAFPGKRDPRERHPGFTRQSRNGGPSSRGRQGSQGTGKRGPAVRQIRVWGPDGVKDGIS